MCDWHVHLFHCTHSGRLWPSIAPQHLKYALLFSIIAIIWEEYPGVLTTAFAVRDTNLMETSGIYSCCSSIGVLALNPSLPNLTYSCSPLVLIDVV